MADNDMKLFLRLTKVDAAKRLVYGTAAAEELDKANEIFDYDTSKPNFEAWSAEISKASSGKSLGNVRAMHGKVAAGRLDQLVFNDEAKAIEVCAKVVDDNEWSKVEEGVYTGFSIGGRYAKRWKDGDAFRYTADPSEISLVDNPCVKSATFSMIKMDGSTEDRSFKEPVAPAATEVAKAAPTNDEIALKARELAKAAGDEALWPRHVEAAIAELAKAVPAVEAPAPATETPEASPRQPEPELEQVWKAKDGQTFKTKAEAKAHNDELAKAAIPQPQAVTDLNAAMDALKKGVDAKTAPAETPAPAATPVVEKAASKIKTKEDLAAAIKMYGRAKDKKVAKANIIASATSLGLTDALPDAWKTDDAKAAKMYDFGVLQKGLCEVSRLASLLESLEWLHQSVEYEAAYEKDNSTVPASLKADIVNLAATLRAMVEEETNELLNEEEAIQYGELLEMADVPAGKDALAKLLGDKAPAALAKYGSKYVAPAPVVPAPDAELQKRLDSVTLERDQLSKAITDVIPVVKDLSERVKKMEDQPMPGGPRATQFTVVGKGEEDAANAGALLAEINKNNPEAIATALIKMSQGQPQRFGGNVPGTGQ